MPEPSYLAQVSEEHLATSEAAAQELARLLSTRSTASRNDRELDVRIGHYDHGALLSIQLQGFALLGLGDEGLLLDFAEGDPATLAVVVNQPVDVQITSTLNFISSLVERQRVSQTILESPRGTSDIDVRMAQVDQEAADFVREAIRLGRWKDTAVALARRAESSGFGLVVHHVRPLLEEVEIAKRTPLMRHVYNSFPDLRRHIDRTTAALASAMQIHGRGVPPEMLAKSRELLDLHQVRAFIAHVLRDAFVCGNGFLEIRSGGQLRLLPPERVIVRSRDQFDLRQPDGSISRVADPVLHLKGARQVGSPYGLSILEPFVQPLGAQESIAGAIRDMDRPEIVDDRKGPWLAAQRDLLARVEAGNRERIASVLGSGPSLFPVAENSPYFAGHELMSPASPTLRRSGLDAPA